ncbi:hypothetical protein ABVT39_004878 [Epinephelus coioides]
MERRYYSNYTMDNNAYNYHDVDTRRNEYADVRDRTPSPLRNIQQRRSYEVCANRRLYEEPEAQDHRMYGRDIHTRRNMNTGRDNHTEHKMHVYPRRSHVFNGTRVDVPRSNSGQPHLADGYIRGPSTVTCGTQVKRDIPPRWLNPPDSGRPVNKQRRIDRCRDNSTVGGKYENPTNRILHSEDRKRVHGPTGKGYQSRSEATFCSQMTGALRPSTSTAAWMTEALWPSTSTASTAGRMPEALRPSTSTAGETMCVNPKKRTRVAQIPKVPERQAVDRPITDNDDAHTSAKPQQSNPGTDVISEVSSAPTAVTDSEVVPVITPESNITQPIICDMFQAGGGSLQVIGNVTEHMRNVLDEDLSDVIEDIGYVNTIQDSYAVPNLSVGEPQLATEWIINCSEPPVATTAIRSDSNFIHVVPTDTPDTPMTESEVITHLYPSIIESFDTCEPQCKPSAPPPELQCDRYGSSAVFLQPNPPPPQAGMPTLLSDTCERPNTLGVTVPQQPLFLTPPQVEMCGTYDHGPDVTNNTGATVITGDTLMAIVKRAILCSACGVTFNRAVICREYLIQLNRPVQCICGCVLCTLCYRDQSGCSAHKIQSTHGAINSTANSLASCLVLMNEGQWDLDHVDSDAYKTERDVNIHVQSLTQAEQPPDIAKLQDSRCVVLWFHIHKSGITHDTDHCLFSIFIAFNRLITTGDTMCFKYWQNEALPEDVTYRYVCIPYVQGFWDHIVVGTKHHPATEKLVGHDDHLPKLFNVCLGSYRFHWCRLGYVVHIGSQTRTA